MATPGTPVDPSIITSLGGRFIRTSDGRVVEYSVHEPFLSTDQSSQLVLVTAYVADYLLRQNVNVKYKTISISLPGLGHSDFHSGRQDISQWPETDLQPILQAESVDRFIYWGESLGTQYAIAVGQYFGERVSALGLRVPFLPRSLSAPHKLPDGQPALPTTQQIAQNTLTVRATRWILGIILRHMILEPSRFVNWLMRKGFMGRNMQSMIKYMDDYPEESLVLKNLTRYFGPDAMMYACAEDVILSSPSSVLDPRTMHVAQHKKLVVWYALDDDDCPPSHGKWIVDTIPCYHVREMNGYGHVGGAFLEMDAFLDKLVECAAS